MWAKLLLKAMTGSMFLLKLGYVLMVLACIATGAIGTMTVEI